MLPMSVAGGGGRYVGGLWPTAHSGPREAGARPHACSPPQAISAKHVAATDSAYGLALMALYLVADGMTSTTQERMFRGYTMSTYNQMLFTNLFSAAMSIVGTAVLPPPPPC